MPTQENEYGILLSPIGPRAELENDRLHQCIEVAESDKELLELDRLLYVACTRARETLHLIGSVSINEDKDSFRAPPESSLLGRIWPAVEREYAEAYSRRENLFEGTSDKTAQFEAPPFRRFQLPFELPLAPDLPVRPKSYSARESDPSLEFYWAGMAARHAGTIVHRWLKKIADRSLTISVSSVGDLRQATIRMAVELGVAEVGVDEVCNRVEESLRGILQDPRGQWLLSGNGHAELPISGIWGDQAVSVIIDRVRIDQGVHWIVDYKTSSHQGGDLGQFLEQESVRYHRQLQKYATLYRRIVDAPVKTALYFPLLQEFRELDID
jgi:ATP-dependent exoDNAse (exonuclease V) beta subunit